MALCQAPVAEPRSPVAICLVADEAKVSNVLALDDAENVRDDGVPGMGIGAEVQLRGGLHLLRDLQIALQAVAADRLAVPQKAPIRSDFQQVLRRADLRWRK